MRTTSLGLLILVCLAIAGAYFAGHYMGQADAQDGTADAVFYADAARSAESFATAASIRQALRESDPARAELLAVRDAALKVPSLVACAASPECAAAVGARLPTKAQLDEALAARRALREQP
ncbi:hypothetical protein ACFPOE_10180 [Caenimonas terrae]|uniref:Uncharacterized protein n=1 Tax=Caenimonas terrae TaxID=696074 RepID=A0ABW0ND98_9BURK